MPYGIDENGFTIKPLETVKTEVEDSLKTNINPALNVAATSLFGQIISIISSKLSELWEVGQAEHRARDPEAAEGASLDELASLTGVLREPASKSTVTATINIDNGVTVTIGSIASVSGNSAARFLTIEEIQNTSGITANFDVEMEAEETGPIVANSGTLTVIETPISGWNSITNALDAELGAVVESDADLRIRRDSELRAQGRGTFEAIRAALLSVDNVEEVLLFENETLVTDINGVPGKAFEAVVLGGTDQDIVDKIFEYKPIGIQSYGSTNGTAEDSQGNTHDVDFSRPTETNLFIDADVTTNPDTFPGTGESDIKTALVEFAESTFSIGDDIIVSQLYAPIFGISGVTDVSSILVYDSTSLGSESLNEGNFATHTDWDVTGDFTDNTGAAVYTHSAGAGTLTQTSANLAIAGVANRFYSFTYTVSGVTAGCTANITTAFADEAQPLTLTNGTHTLYFFSAASPGNFVISATSTAGGFTLDDLSLKILNTASGNYNIDAREIGLFDTSRIGLAIT